jgi:Lon protease-like protein
MAVEVPLFPLGIVLFPHMEVELHIFEPRYREMMRDCSAEGIGFGVISIADGREIGEGAHTHSVGTLAKLLRVDALDDGDFDLVVSGATRFRVLSTSRRRPYLTGAIEYLEDVPGDTVRAAQLAPLVAAEFQRYAATLAELAGAEPPDPDEALPADPELLSYVVAAGLRIPNVARQALLEIASAEARLRSCLAHLRRETHLLDHRLAPRDGRSVIVVSN